MTTTLYSHQFSQAQAQAKCQAQVQIFWHEIRGLAFYLSEALLIVDALYNFNQSQVLCPPMSSSD